MDDRILDAQDMAEEIEQAKNPERQFEDVINEWTNRVLAENQKFVEPETGLLIMRLGTLGQRLIYEANAIGMRDCVEIAKKVSQ